MPDSVDVSSYPRPQPPQNPLDQIMKVGQAADTIGNLEVGKGIQAAIQPDGSIDRNTLAQILKGSVAGSMKAPQALSAIEQLRQAGHTADEAAIRNQVGQIDYVGKLLGPLADKKEVSKEELTNVAGKAIANATKLGLTGYIPDVAKFLAQTNGDPRVTDAQRAKIVADHHFQSQTVARQLEAELPQTAPYNTGANTGTAFVGSQRNPQAISMATAPGPSTGTVDTRERLPDGKPNPNYGQPMIIGAGTSAPPPITRTDVRGNIIPPVRQFTEGSTVVGREPPVNAATGQPLAQTQTPQAAAANGPVPNIPNPAAGPIPTGLPPQVAEQMAASQKNYTAHQEFAGNYRTAVNPLVSAIPLLEKVTTGPLTEGLNKIQAAAESLGVKIPTSENVKNYAEATKYLMQNATAIAPPGTNVPSVMAAFESNPNMGQPSGAVRDLSKAMLALNRYKLAAYKEFEKTGYPSTYFNKWAANEWSLSQDPRAYGADLMTAEQRSKLEKSIKPGSEAAKRFKNSLDTAAHTPGLLGDVEGHPFGGGG